MGRPLSLSAIVRLAVSITGWVLLIYNARFLSLTSAWIPIFISVIAVVRLAELELPQGDKVALDAALVIAVLLLFDLPTALLIAVGGMAAAAVSRQPRPTSERLIFQAAERATVMAVSAMWTGGRYMTAFGAGETLDLLGWDFLRAVGLCATFFGLETILDQFFRSQKQAVSLIPSLLDSLSFAGSIDFSLAAIGILIAMMYPGMGMWGVFIFCLPLVVVRYAFKQFLDIKYTYRHTIAALTRAIQVEDFHQRSHSERVADLAIDIGKELGFHGQRLEALGYAALLHDIGKLGLDIDSFDSVLDSGQMEAQTPAHALIGAEILEQVTFLRPHAAAVRRHHQPFDGRRHTAIDHPFEARIIAIANYFDQLTQSPLIERRLSTNQAVARIKKESSLFDPKVLRALVNVLKRQHRIVVAN